MHELLDTLLTLVTQRKSNASQKKEAEVRRLKDATDSRIVTSAGAAMDYWASVELGMTRLEVEMKEVIDSMLEGKRVVLIEEDDVPVLLQHLDETGRRMLALEMTTPVPGGPESRARDVKLASLARLQDGLKDERANMADAHAQGLHAGHPREFCPECE